MFWHCLMSVPWDAVIQNGLLLESKKVMCWENPKLVVRALNTIHGFIMQ